MGETSVNLPLCRTTAFKMGNACILLVVYSATEAMSMLISDGRYSHLKFVRYGSSVVA